METRARGSVQQHKAVAPLDSSVTPAQLGVPARSGGPHFGRGRQAQIPTVSNPMH
ncbi:hypothetical protein JZ751_010706 [Albula glossodonta]|uniref:Uncharacterized protein n=1 Tax=Albula glossodonta TaxID=121402 RepID=A0A8T2MME4_9TELE|nr:hypothetical protein JZ751_010706 [Albula glossodonta]